MTTTGVLLLLVASFGLWHGHKRTMVPAAKAPQRTYPEVVRIVIDSSRSMQGYFAGATEFKDNLDQLASKLEKLRALDGGLKSVQYDTVGEHGAPQPTPFDTKQFIARMRSGDLMVSHESLLQDTYKEMIASNTASEVSILVSDSIVSYPDDDIRHNREINKESLKGLGSEVQTVFLSAAKKSQSVVLLAFRSSFHGIYFTYRNDNVPCCSGERPYYMWLLGERGRVTALAEYLASEGLQADGEALFTRETIDLPHAVLQNLLRTGNFYRRGDGIEIDRSPGQVRFAVALDLSEMPSYMWKPDFLASHLHVQSPGLDVVSFETKSRNDVAKLPRNDAAKYLPHYTHVVVVTVAGKPTARSTLDVGIDASPPEWYKTLSNNDDRRVRDEKSGTTFGLSALIEGISGAYNKHQPIAKASVDVEN